MTRIIRVFPRRTSMTPDDEMAFVGDPPMMRPEADEVHVSVVFTWDVEEGKRLRQAWAQYYPVVKIGGPAMPYDFPGEFTPGMYLKKGAVITSRGCNYQCPWCMVPHYEGRTKLLRIKDGWNIQDNNLLQTGRDHISKVIAMLEKQDHRATFGGGIDARLVDDWFTDQIKSLRIDQLFLAADTDNALPRLERAIKKLGHLRRGQLRCYTLIGMSGTIEENTQRLERVWEIGAMPFAQLYQPPYKWINYPKEWKDLARTWSRPAAMKAVMK